MNMQVQFWLDEQKRRSEAAEASLRRSHLTRLGLVDPETKQPYDVTDEEYAEICKYAPPVTDSGDEKPRSAEQPTVIDDKAEKWLLFFAKLYIALGIICWVAGIVGALAYGLSMGYSGPVSILVGIVGGFLVFAAFGLTWALLKTIANISLRLKNIGR